jgi:hypothetical protein
LKGFFHQNKNQKKGTKLMKLAINEPINVFDLANALSGDSGTFLCQNGGSVYLVVAKEGHSIALGPTPVGRTVAERETTFNLPVPWTLTKISEEDISAEFNSGGIRQRVARTSES